MGATAGTEYLGSTGVSADPSLCVSVALFQTESVFKMEKYDPSGIAFGHWQSIRDIKDILTNTVPSPERDICILNACLMKSAYGTVLRSSPSLKKAVSFLSSIFNYCSVLSFPF